MKYKAYIKLIALLAMLMSFAACSDWLDLKPQNEIVVDDFWKTGSDVENVVASCYRGMLEDGFMEKIILWGELRSDDVVAGKDVQGDQSKILDVNILSDNSICKWGNLYTVIDYCNTVLHYAPGVMNTDPNFTAARLKQYQAEVLTLRALCYFYLVRTFKDVPYVTVPTIDDKTSLSVPQTPEAAVLDSLVQDLRTAETNAPASWTTELFNTGRITKNAVRTLLADIYLWQGNYKECISTCDRVISSGKYQLVSGPYIYENVFYLGNSKESIFELQFSDDNKNNKVFDYYGNSSDPFGQLSAADFSTFSTATDSLFSKSDTRTLNAYVPISNGYYNIYKYVGSGRFTDSSNKTIYGYRNGTPNWIFYRFSDVLLMKAEALVFANNGVEADLRESLALVNQTYTRSNPEKDPLSFSNYSSSEKMETLVLNERQREFVFEGKRWFDLLRKARRDGKPDAMLDNFLLRKYPTNTKLVRTKLSQLNALYLPIHADELTANKLLVQNPYYNTGN